MSHNFAESMNEGNKGEAALDSYFRMTWTVQPVDMDMQRRGIDRIFISPRNQSEMTVEYKTDFEAHETNNAFVETVSVDKQQSKGWALRSQAQILIYYIFYRATAFYIEMPHLRQRLTNWQKNYATGRAENYSYSTHGILVPLFEFATCATHTYSVSAFAVE